MSKFIERLQQVNRPAAQSMGFKTARTEQSRPKLQLVANITGAKAKPAAKEINAADAIILPGSDAGAAKITWGMSVKGREEVNQAVKSGADFVILSIDGEVLPADVKIGKILKIDAAITDILLRTANDLPVDAVLLSEDSGSGLKITWRRMMLIQRFSSLLNKPLLIEVLPDISHTELQQMWEEGVSGIIVTASNEQAEAVTQNIRQIIDKLSFPSRRKHDKAVAVLPRLQNQPEDPEEDEEDE